LTLNCGIPILENEVVLRGKPIVKGLGRQATDANGRRLGAVENQFVICIEDQSPVALGALGNQADLLGARGPDFKSTHHPVAAANPGIPACYLLDRSSQTGR
jgi:hypothetical protein